MKILRYILPFVMCSFAPKTIDLPSSIFNQKWTTSSQLIDVPKEFYDFWRYYYEEELWFASPDEFYNYYNIQTLYGKYPRNRLKFICFTQDKSEYLIGLEEYVFYVQVFYFHVSNKKIDKILVLSAGKDVKDIRSFRLALNQNKCNIINDFPNWPMHWRDYKD